MHLIDIIAQMFGIAGMFFNVISFQEKRNNKLIKKQCMSGVLFFLNFILIGAVSAALLNLAAVVRGILFLKRDGKIWRLIVTESLFTLCFSVSLFSIWEDPFQIFLSSLTFIGLFVMTLALWKGNGKHIRYVQMGITSPAWIIHNIFNFTLGGILCELFAILSIVASFIRYGKDGFENEKNKNIQKEYVENNT